MISLPPESGRLIPALLTTRTIEEFAATLKPVTERAIGPAYVGYATSLREGSTLARSFTSVDAAALEQLQAAFDKRQAALSDEALLLCSATISMTAKPQASHHSRPRLIQKAIQFSIPHS